MVKSEIGQKLSALVECRHHTKTIILKSKKKKNFSLFMFDVPVWPRFCSGRQSNIVSLTVCNLCIEIEEITACNYITSINCQLSD